jgi:acyl-CoA thioester hydrolase
MNSPLPERTVSSPNRVPFRDVDMHGHVHNAVYLSYAEAAINDFLRAFGLAGEFGPGTTGRSYLVKKAELVFESPLRFDDLLDIHVELSRLGTTSLAFSARVMRGPEAVVCARAEIV